MACLPSFGMQNNPVFVALQFLAFLLNHPNTLCEFFNQKVSICLYVSNRCSVTFNEGNWKHENVLRVSWSPVSTVLLSFSAGSPIFVSLKNQDFISRTQKNHLLFKKILNMFLSLAPILPKVASYKKDFLKNLHNKKT